MPANQKDGVVRVTLHARATPTFTMPREVLSTSAVFPALNYEAYGTLLEDAGANTYSQFGEDGLIAEVFRSIGTTNKVCFEFGASDGTFCSNTRKLCEDGWHGVWIEAHERIYDELLKNKPDSVTSACAKVTPENVDELLLNLGVPALPDLGIIDVDGLDLLIWQGMQRIEPRVILVEYTNKTDALEDGKPAPMWAVWNYGVYRGYRVVARTWCNLLFVRNELCLDGRFD